MSAPSNFFPLLALESVMQQTYDYELPVLKFREFIPVSHEVPSGAESWSYYQYERSGSATLLKSYSNDVGSVDSVANRFNQQIVGFGCKYSYSIQELRASEMAQQSGGFAGLPLDVKKGQDARWFLENQLNTVAGSGISEIGLKGITNHTSVPIVSGLTGTWNSASADQIVEDIRLLYSAVVANTKENHTPNTLLLPIAKYTRLTKRLDATNVSILDYVKANFPGLNVASWDVFSGAGVSSVDRMCMYQRDPRVLEFVIPQEFEQLPPQFGAFLTEIYCHVRCGGLQVRFPLAMAYGDGI